MQNDKVQDFSKYNYEQLVLIVGDHITSRDNYQTTLGQAASAVKEKRGSGALRGLAEDVKAFGRTVSPKTLRNYAWVWEKTGHFKLPADVTYRAKQEIAGTKNPEKWVRLLEKGYSSAELVRLIKKSKGLKEKKKKCPKCGFES